MATCLKKLTATTSALILFSVILLLAPAIALSAPDAELVKIPVSVGAVYQLDAKIYKPSGDGPFPLIVLAHGTPRTAEDRKKTLVDTYYKTQSEYFAGKGYTVVFVVRRGFGTSTAPYAESTIKADGTGNYFRAGLEAAKDLRAAVEYMKSKPYIDPKRIILIGQSTGGHSVIATGSLGLDGVIGIVNFAGGRGSTAPDQVHHEDDLINSMGRYGKTSHVPSLWLYSENDHYFRPAVARAMYKAYTESGGQATFIALPPYSDDGHKSFVGNRGAWEQPVLKFLEELSAR